MANNGIDLAKLLESERFYGIEKALQIIEGLRRGHILPFPGKVARQARKLPAATTAADDTAA